MERSQTPSAGRWAEFISRYGRRTLIALAVIAAAGFMVRATFVVFPDRTPGDDALAYRALAESLYKEGSYGGPGFRTPSDWSPGAPLIYAGSYFLTGGVRDGVARGVEALFGTGTILVAFFLTASVTGPGIRRRRGADPAASQRADEPRERPGDRPGPSRPSSVADRGDPKQNGSPGPAASLAIAPLLAAALVAFYPPFATATGSLMSEPPAEFTLPAAILAFFWADRGSGLWPWLLPGFLFGLTILIRPEYMAIAALFAIFLLLRHGATRTWGRGAAVALIFGAAALVPVVPWTVHNYVTLDRLVPVTTGSGKALFTGTYRPGDGEYQRVKAALLKAQTGRSLEPGSPQLDRVDPVPLFNRMAERYPDLERDAALGRIGRENLERYLKDDPAGYLGMTVRKAWRMWGSASGGFLSHGFGALIQKLLVALGIAGLILLAWRRRWEAIAFAIPILGITGIAALTLAPPRRNEILMTLILPLGSVALVALLDRLRPGGGPVAAEPSPSQKVIVP